MAEPFKHLFYVCRLIKNTGRISDCWFYNGNLNVKLTDGLDRTQISHKSDLVSLLQLNSEEELDQLLQ